MSPTLGDTHHDAVRFPPAEPSDRHVRVGPVNMICPCLLTPVQTPRKATNASRAFSALALGHGWPGEQVPSSSLAAIPAKRSRGPSSHQIGPSPSQTWEGVHLKVSPREMTGTSAFAPRGPITKTANPKIAWGMRNFVMAESFMFLVYHEFRILFAASDTAKRKVQTRVLQVQRMSGMTGRNAASEVIDERQQWAVPSERPKGLDFNGFHNCQGVFKFNAKISHRAVHLGVTQQKLNSTQVARLLVDLCDLRPSH